MIDPENDPLIQIGVSGALAKKYSEDQRAFAEELADSLVRALPAETAIERKGGLFGPKKLTAISVQLADAIFRLELPAQGRLQPERIKVVRGIKLKTEAMDMQSWLQALGAAIAEHTSTNLSARDALGDLFGG